MPLHENAGVSLQYIAFSKECLYSERAPMPEGPLQTFRIAINTTLVDPIVRPDDIVICQWWDSARINAAEELGAKVLIYQNTTRAHDPEGPENLYSTGLTLEQAEELGAATEEKDGTVGTICLPGTSGYAEAWLAAAIGRAEEVGADGVFCDDMNAWNKELGGGYSKVTEAEWNSQMQAFNEVVGPGLAEAGLLAIANMSGAVGQANIYSHGWLEKQFAFYAGGLDEFFVTWGTGTVMSPEFIAEAVGILERQTKSGKLYLCTSHGTDPNANSYALSLCLMHAQNGNAQFFTEHEGYGSQAWPLALETALELGAPTQPPQEPVRTFNGGWVFGGLTDQVGTISLGTPSPIKLISVVGVKPEVRTSQPIPIPPGAKSGDLLIIMHYLRYANGAGEKQSYGGGFNLVNEVEQTGNPSYDERLVVLRTKSLSTTLKISWKGVPRTAGIVVAAYRGGWVANAPIDFSTANIGGKNSAMVALGGTTKEKDETLTICGADAVSAASNAAPPGFTRRFDENELFYADALQASASATGNKTVSLGEESHWSAIMVAILPK